MPQHVRLRTYLSLLLLVTTAVTFSLIGGLILAIRIPEIGEEAKQTVQREAQEKARLLEFALSGLESQLRPVASITQYASAREVGSILQALVGRGEQFRAAYVVGDDGIVRAGGVALDGGDHTASVTGGDLSRNPLFQAVKTKPVAWSDKYLSAQSGNVVIGVALRQGRWTVIGEVAPAYLKDTVSTVTGQGANPSLVVDRSGEWIAGTTSHFGPGDNLGAEPIVLAALAGQAAGSEQPYRSGRVFSGSAQPERLGWTFIVTRPAGLANPDIRRNYLLIGIGFGGSLVIGLFIALWWTGMLARPLQRMIDRTHRLAEGDYSETGHVASRIVELNAFGHDLQRMADAISEREASLARSEERLRATIENAPSVAIQWYDRDAVCRYWNPASTMIYGFRRDEAVGRSLVGMLWTEEQKDEFVSLVREIERTGEPSPPTEFTIRHKDGHLVTVLASVFAIPDADGGMQFVCLDVDITERKRAESALLASQKELQSIFNASPVPMSVSDVKRGCRIIKVNEAWLRQFAYTPEGVLGRHGGEISLYADPQDRAAFIDRFARGPGIYEDMELWLKRADGSHLLCHVSAHIIEVAGQQLLLMASEDITGERRMAAELRNMNEELEARVQQRTSALSTANEELSTAIARLKETQGQLVQSEKLAALGRLVAGVAHELNTPIGNGLMAVTTLTSHHDEFRAAVAEGLRRSTLDRFIDNVGAAADIATRNLERAAELIASFKQIAVDQTSSQRRSFDLSHTVEEILTALGPTLSRSGHRIAQNIAPGLRLDSYPGPLGQVLTNLIDNAINHAFGDRKEGSLRIEAKATDGDRISVLVTDDGCGIPSEHLGRIFDPFFTTRLGQGGSGLGLHIVHNIVTGMLGGSIEVASEAGVGTRFTITLPRTAPAEPLE